MAFVMPRGVLELVHSEDHSTSDACLFQSFPQVDLADQHGRSEGVPHACRLHQFHQCQGEPAQRKGSEGLQTLDLTDE